MRIAIKATLATLATLATTVVTGGCLDLMSGASTETAVPIPDGAFVGFENCGASKELVAITDDLLAHGHPIAKEGGVWVYAVDGRFMGIPIHHLELGVCNSSGERDCGWANYTGLGMDISTDQAKQVLKNKSGIDFTEEKRDEEVDATMRPILTTKNNTTGSLLFCDPGQL